MEMFGEILKSCFQSIDGFFRFLDHPIQQRFYRNNIVDQAHAHTGTEDRTVNIPVQEPRSSISLASSAALFFDTRIMLPMVFCTRTVSFSPWSITHC